jgi:hypothetical protein
MKSFDDLATSIKVYAPGVADPTMYFAIRQAASEFCERTRLWRFQDTFTVTASECEALYAPQDSEVFEIEYVDFNGVKLDPKDIGWLDDNMRGWRTGELTGLPKYFTQSEPNTISLAPRYSGTVNLSLWLKTSQDATTLPDWVVSQYRETIAHGALARILFIPNQSFTNPELGAAFGSSFAGKLNELSSKGFTGQQRAPIRTRASFY